MDVVRFQQRTINLTTLININRCFTGFIISTQCSSCFIHWLRQHFLQVTKGFINLVMSLLFALTWGIVVHLRAHPLSSDNSISLCGQRPIFVDGAYPGQDSIFPPPHTVYCPSIFFYLTSQTAKRFVGVLCPDDSLAHIYWSNRRFIWVNLFRSPHSLNHRCWLVKEWFENFGQPDISLDCHEN